MKEALTPEKIQNSFKIGDLSKEDAAKSLISLIEGSDNAATRVESIKLLEKIDFRSEELFKFIENHLISDEDAIIRALAVKIIILNFLNEGTEPLRWVIQHDKSPLVMKAILDTFENYNTEHYQLIEKDLELYLEMFAANLDVVPEEARFFLDIESLFAQNKRNYETNFSIYKSFQVFNSLEPWLVIRNKHVEMLNFNYYHWNFVKENQDIIESFSNLKYLDVYLTLITKYNSEDPDFIEIPESIGSLTSLKKLILRRNKLLKIPKSIKNLSSLIDLDLSYNNLQEIPHVLESLPSLEKLNLKNNKIHNSSGSMKYFLNSLKYFKI